MQKCIPEPVVFAYSVSTLYKLFLGAIGGTEITTIFKLVNTEFNSFYEKNISILFCLIRKTKNQNKTTTFLPKSVFVALFSTLWLSAIKIFFVGAIAENE